GDGCDSQPVPRPGVCGFVVALPRVTSSEASPGCVNRRFTSHALGYRSAGHQPGHPSSRMKNTHCRSRLSRGASRVGLKGLWSPLQGPAVVITFPSRPDDGAQGGPTMAKSVYGDTYARSMRDPEGFWAAAAADVHWDRRWDRVLDDS